MAYIEKHKLMNRIETEALRWGEEYDLSQIMGDIEDFPESDVVEVKHGKWIIDTSIKARGFYEVNYKVLITCSICGNRHCLGEQPYPTFKQKELKTDTYRKYRYCGECGAKMDGNT